MMKKIIYSEDYISTGLLVLRIGIGIAFMLHGFPKVFSGGAEGLALGLAKAGIPGGVAAAYLAGFAEFFGGIALLTGIFFRIATIVLAFTMATALAFHVSLGDNFITFSHALESLVLFIALIITGPGRFSLDYYWFCSSNEKECSPKSYSRFIRVPSH